MSHNYALPALLLRQLLLLAFFAGIFATRHPAPALVAMGLLVLHQWGRIFAPGRRFAALMLLSLILSFALGAAYTAWRAEPLPAPPNWARLAFSPTVRHLALAHESLAPELLTGEAGAKRGSGALPVWQAADNRHAWPGDGIEPDGIFRQGRRYRARVARVEGRADRSLRLILEDLRPLTGWLPNQAGPYAGRVAFTWYRALTPEGRRPLPPDTPDYLRREISAAPLSARPLPGDEVELKLRLREIRGLKNPGLWDIEPYWADQGVGLRAWEQGEGPGLEIASPGGFFWAGRREAWRQQVLEALPQSGGQLAAGAELIPALLFGDKYLLDSRDAELFARSTLAHSLALSGLHLGYAAALGYAVVFLLYRLRPGLGTRLPRRKAALLGGALPALCYLWLGGAPPSLLRAALMLAFVGWAMYRGRPQVLADGLIWALTLILFWHPATLFDLRLQLSALCIAALAWAGPLFARLNAALRGRFLGWRLVRGAALLLLGSLVIQVALAPLLVKSFGLYGLAMPLNLLWLPVLGFVVMPCIFLGFFALLLQLPGLGELFMQLAALPCGALLDFLRQLDAWGGLPALLPPRPHWLTMLGFWFLLLLVPALLARGRAARPKAALALAILALPLLWPAPGGLRLRLLDVGQGQSLLLEWGGRRLLVDGGGSSSPRFDVGREVVAASLAQNRLPRLDYLLASHLDKDHAGGLLFVLRHLRVGAYADNGEPLHSGLGRELAGLLAEQKLPRRVLRAGDRLDLGGGLRLELLHPNLPRELPPAAVFDGNKNSLVLRLVWQQGGAEQPLALICGDVDKAAQRALLRRLPAESLRAEALILPHHGSKSSLLPDFYRAVAPRLALASAAYYNSWNFPSPELSNALRGLNIPLLSTARQGQIMLRWAAPGAEPELATARSGELVWE